MKPNSTTRFGESLNDSLYSYKENYTYNLPTEWGPKYEAARIAADAAIKKYGLSEDDFWVKKELSPFKDKIVYSNLILSHSGCIKVNNLQPKERQFKPGCVREGKGTQDGGVALIYSSDEQKLFKTGEASPRNSNVSFLYAVAEKRLFDRVVTALSGLYEEGVYGEDEADAFRKNRNVIPNDEAHDQNSPSAKQTMQVKSSPAIAQKPSAPAVASPSPLTASERAELISTINDGVSFTQTNIRTMLDYYSVFSLEEMSDAALIDCEDKICKKVEKRKAALEEAKAAIAATAPPKDMAQNLPQEDSGRSVIAAMLMTDPAEAEPGPVPIIQADPDAVIMPSAEIPLGETVYVVSANAPQNFQDLSGQTFDQIGKEMMRGLYRRKNASGRNFVDEELLKKIEAYIA